ncbi:UNVERIFIED_CONTAM: BTB/POZ domain-containing protein FBL11 [Sesamum radiatum]|uniref:BTB/POZ domain-containing protein FBL11 n=1 Tax=Sesamum radiatum TaxID=300843 RepID=A0AAW2NPE6_SESRA
MKLAQLSNPTIENGLSSVSVHWDVESFANVLRFIFGCPVEITSNNFIPLNEAALFFGVETLLLKCRVWLEEVTSQSQLLCLDSLIDIWKYGLERGVTGKLLCELISGADNLRSLCLREIQLVDDALYRFSGASLEMLDVSDTEVSVPALAHVIRRNPDLKSLKIRGCRHLLQQESETKERKLCIPSFTPQDFYSELGKSCKLEEFEVGWGFSFFSLAALKPAITTLRSLVVGLGGSLGHDGLKLLPTICPMLEILILYFQVISDSAITEILRTLPHLQFLALCYCFGDISSLSFKFDMPNLRNLKLERVTPWMTNEELATLAENCTNLVKLSLIGCTLLDCEAQAIISSGWPGLTSLHLEECGEITANGVRSLLDCHALEDLILRHTLPMLRKISLDVCDASEGDFDIPSMQTSKEHLRPAELGSSPNPGA